MFPLELEQEDFYYTVKVLFLQTFLFIGLVHHAYNVSLACLYSTSC